ncbi:hypothetical protein [Romboutsia hominis]|uniref:hypothetical protein n=1 Tax=Romboutsia hominis TaxID=1507512 RepID=UPI000A83E57A|nr:hypothetical protein [Romboutsia hominis]
MQLNNDNMNKNNINNKSLQGQGTNQQFPGGSQNQGTNQQFPGGSQNQGTNQLFPGGSQNQGTNQQFPGGSQNQGTNQQFPGGSQNQGTNQQFPGESQNQGVNQQFPGGSQNQGTNQQFQGGSPGQVGLPSMPPQPQPQQQQQQLKSKPQPDSGNERSRVKIKSVFDDKFVVIGRDVFLYATAQNANSGDTFRLIIDGNKARIREAGGSFVRVDNRDFLIADTDRRGATEFTIYRTGDREYVLRAPNGYFVRVRESDARLVARAVNADERTRFKFRRVD